MMFIRQLSVGGKIIKGLRGLRRAGSLVNYSSIISSIMEAMKQRAAQQLSNKNAIGESLQLLLKVREGYYQNGVYERLLPEHCRKCTYLLRRSLAEAEGIDRVVTLTLLGQIEALQNHFDLAKAAYNHANFVAAFMPGAQSAVQQIEHLLADLQVQEQSFKSQAPDESGFTFPEDAGDGYRDEAAEPTCHCTTMNLCRCDSGSCSSCYCDDNQQCTCFGKKSSSQK